MALQQEDTFLERRLRTSRLLRICQKLKPDIVYSRWIKLNIALAKARRKDSVQARHIIHVVNTLSSLLSSSWLNRALFWKNVCNLYPEADLIVCNGTIVRGDLTSRFGLPSTKCVYLPNILSSDDFAVSVEGRETALVTPHEPLRIVCVGRIGPQKDYVTLLKAVAKIRKDVPVQIAVFGKGPDRPKLEQAIVDFGLEQVVRFRGFVPNPQLFFPEFDILVSCSRYEGMSNVMLEAMAAGLPVVVTEVSGSRDVLTEPSHGVTFPPGDADGLASILRSLAYDRQRLVMLSRGGKRRAADFAISKLSTKYQEVFSSVLKKGSCAVG